MSEIISRHDDVCFSYVDVGSGPPLLFSHANGFPSSVYKPIFHMMANNFHTMGLNFCGACSCRIMNLVRFLALTRQRHRTPLAVGARRRRDNWTSRKDAREYFSDKALFKSWDERMFDSYIEDGLVETPDGVELAFPKGLEAFLFGSVPTSMWKYIKRMKKEALIVRGEESDVLTDDTWELLKHTRPDVEYLELSRLGHLFPMQAPEMTAEIIVDFAS